MVTPDKRTIAGNRKPFSTEQAGLARSYLDSPDGNMPIGDHNKDERCQSNNIRVFNGDSINNTHSNIESG